jgi:hypothetical protein
MGGGFYHVDLRRFADRIVLNTGVAALRITARALSSDLDGTIYQEPWAGSERDSGTAFGSYGLAIYFPVDKRTFDNDRWNDHSYDKPATNLFEPYPVAFVADHTWSDFLHAYFDVVQDANK